jgi:hypothetical protein
MPRIQTGPSRRFGIPFTGQSGPILLGCSSKDFGAVQRLIDAGGWSRGAGARDATKARTSSASCSESAWPTGDGPSWSTAMRAYGAVLAIRLMSRDQGALSRARKPTNGGLRSFAASASDFAAIDADQFIACVAVAEVARITEKFARSATHA